MLLQGFECPQLPMTSVRYEGLYHLAELSNKLAPKSYLHFNCPVKQKIPGAICAIKLYVKARAAHWKLVSQAEYPAWCVIHPVDATFAPVVCHYSHDMLLGDRSGPHTLDWGWPPPAAPLRYLQKLSPHNRAFAVYPERGFTAVSAQNKGNDIFFNFILYFPWKSNSLLQRGHFSGFQVRPRLAIHLGKG